MPAFVYAARMVMQTVLPQAADRILPASLYAEQLKEMIAIPAMPITSRQPDAAPAPASVNYLLVFKSAAVA